MRSFFAAAIVLGCAVSLSASARQGTAVFSFPYEAVRLENGFRAYLVKAGAPGQVAFEDYW